MTPTSILFIVSVFPHISIQNWFDDGIEVAKYRKNYFDQPSWDDVDRSDDIKMDSLNECGIACNIKESCNVLRFVDGVCQLGYSCERNLRSTSDDTFNIDIFLKEGLPSCNHGALSSWGSWGSCSKSCKGGTKSRYRYCNNPAPSEGGRSCSGTTKSNDNCNTQDCHPESEDCYEDGAMPMNNLPIERDDGEEMTVEYCLTWCRNSNYKLAGIKEGKYCIGTDGSIDLTKEVNKNDCNSECLGQENSTGLCGGPSRWTIYVLDTDTTSTSTPTPTPND